MTQRLRLGQVHHATLTERFASALVPEEVQTACKELEALRKVEESARIVLAHAESLYRTVKGDYEVPNEDYDEKPKNKAVLEDISRLKKAFERLGETVSYDHLSLEWHSGECPHCPNGRSEECDEHEDTDNCDHDCDNECPYCGGQHEAVWVWDDQESGECFQCKNEDTPIMCWDQDNNEWLCRNCAIKLHKDLCGCNLWSAKPEVTP